MPAALLIVLVASGTHAAAASRTATATRTATPLTIDGTLDEPAWAAAPWHTNFTVAGIRGDNRDAHKPAPVQTRFKVLFDDYAVWVGVECDEPRLDQLKAETPWRDGAVWQDDCVELFFDPGNDGRYYHQVMVNSRGTIYDCHAADYGLVHSKLWNGAFLAAGQVDEAAKKWRVEVELPFGALVLGENAGSTWKWNVTRERQAGGATELSTWAPLTGNFHQPRLFGTLAGVEVDYSPFRFRLGEPEVQVSRAASGTARLGMKLTVRNETGRECRAVAEASLFEQPQQRVAAEAQAAPVDRDLTVAFPPLEFRGSTTETNILLALRDPQSKRLLKAVVKNLSSEYRPLSVQLLRPCYRNSIYPTEEVRDLLFRVELSAQVRQATDEVRVSLTGAGAAGTVAETKAEVASLAEPLSLPVPDLKIGEYQLTVSAWSADAKKQAEQVTAIHKLAKPMGNEVRIDKNRNVLVNGKPLFAIGWYGSVPTSDPRAEVVAMQNVQTPTVVTPPEVDSIRKPFEEHGIYSIASVENGRLHFSFKLWQTDKAALGNRIKQELHELSAPSDEMKDLLRQLVECVREEPGLLGYYIADEPEIHDVPSAYLENFYRYLCELDPYHPVFVTNDTIDGIVTHGYKCADVIDPDPYSSEWDYVPNFLKKINEVAGPGKATWVTPWHSSGQAHFTPEYGTVPPYSYSVLRNQYFASICYGAKGFTAYTSPFFLQEIEYRYGLPHLWRELRFLEPAIVAPPSPEPVTVEGATDLATFAREVDDRRYLIAVNHKPDPGRAKIRWTPLAGSKELLVMSEGREVAVRDGAIEDDFGEGAVHIYTDDPRAADFPTTDGVRRELDDRLAKAIKPGNLLHWSRGTKVRCSKGYYAPWFHQFFYYAVNGMTDDIGWSAYSWDRKSTWMEVTMTEASPVGRVVLYTPNLKDYQLDLIAPGGETRRATITGNDEDVVTHTFRPPVTCLKLRLTVTAINPADCSHGSTPLVREIEAYADPGEGPVTATETIAAAGGDVKPLFAAEEGPTVLWREDFSDFQTAPQYYWKGKDTKWVLDGTTFRAKPTPDGRVGVACVSPKGYSQMSHLFAYDPAHRFFQVKLDSVEGAGYKFTNVGFGHSSGKPGYRTAVNTSKPGIYTVDTHYVNKSFRDGTHDKCFVTVGSAGSKKRPDGTADPGPTFTFDWLQLVRTPANGLAVTMTDGVPLPKALKQGDALHFELHLEQPAQDAVVEVLVNSHYAPLAINGQPYVQLRRADDDGRVWVGEVTLGPGTGKYKPGYPVLFKATVSGGGIEETFASASVAFE